MTSNPLVVQSLTKRFGDFTAVDHIDFQVHRGEIFGFLGPNGAGKTTTIRMILGLLTPTDGSVKILGLDVHQKTTELLTHVGYMSQRFSLYNDLTVLQNLRFYGAAYGLKNRFLESRIESALNLAGLEGRENTKTGELSGGWRQRLALGAAILHQPEIIFLDEPTAGVDPVSRRVFWNLLYNLVEQGITIFVTTHYMDEAEHCHRLAFIRRGKIIALGTPSEIKETKMKGWVIEITTDTPARTIEALRNAEKQDKLSPLSIELYGTLVHVVVPKSKGIIKTIEKTLGREGIRVDNITRIEPSLEDVFIAAMK